VLTTRSRGRVRLPIAARTTARRSARRRPPAASRHERRLDLRVAGYHQARGAAGQVNADTPLMCVLRTRDAAWISSARKLRLASVAAPLPSIG
jgi:hypothetical protein